VKKVVIPDVVVPQLVVEKEESSSEESEEEEIKPVVEEVVAKGKLFVVNILIAAPVK